MAEAAAREKRGEKPEEYDQQTELYQIAEKYKLEKKRQEEEGDVNSSFGMLTGIPEVDLGME
jgi:hypothetical protein